MDLPDSLNSMFKKTPFFRDGSAYADLCDGGRVPQRKRELVLMQFTVRHFRHIAMGGTASHGVVDPAREMWLALRKLVALMRITHIYIEHVNLSMDRSGTVYWATLALEHLDALIAGARLP